jgi:hypothetical protein
VIHAALADRLDKTGLPCLLLLDNCYEGGRRTFMRPLLTAGATSSLESVAGILRYVNETHWPNSVIFSALPRRTVSPAPDPRNPEQASLSPIGRGWSSSPRACPPPARPFACPKWLLSSRP